MTWLTRIRISPGIWLAPVMALTSMTYFDAPAAQGYALASATRDAYSLLLVAASHVLPVPGKVIDSKRVGCYSE